MTKAIGIAGLAIGAYFLYQYFQGGLNLGSGNQSSNNNNSNSTPLPIYNIPSLKEKILTAANVGIDKQYNAHEWSYYYAQVSGVGPVDSRFSTAFGDGFGLYTIDQYIAKLKEQGLAGIRGFSVFGANKYEQARKIMN